jgi:hypothetical protein
MSEVIHLHIEGIIRYDQMIINKMNNILSFD